jgi:hypothetical protein
MRAMVLSAYFLCRRRGDVPHVFPDATRWFGRNATDKAE